MQCPSLADLSTARSILADEPARGRDRAAAPGWVRSARAWTHWLAAAVGLDGNATAQAGAGGGHDTPAGVWETSASGVDMSSRPIVVESPARPDELRGSRESVAASGDEAEGLDERRELSDALRAGQPHAVARLFDLYGKHVERVLVRTIGRDGEMEDMVQDVFLGAYRSGPNYQGNDGQLKAWLSRIAVFTARGYLRKRKRRWWVRPADPQELPEQPSNEASPHTQEVLRRTYAALDGMDPDLRIPLALRELESMELSEIAEACDCSVSTVKRRLARARKAFERLAKNDPMLRDWLEDEN